jgi:hypothetical protein
MRHRDLRDQLEVANRRRDCRRIGGVSATGYFRVWSLTGGGRVAWIVRVVKTGAEGEGQCTDVMKIIRPADLSDIADLGLSWQMRSGCWQASNRRSSPGKPGTTLVGGRPARVAARLAM